MIYLDNNATTQPDPAVIEAMLPYYTARWGNASSVHAFGRQLQVDMDAARSTVAEFFGARRASEVIFTSGGTESDNLAIQGICEAQPDKKHVIISQVEHSAIRNCCAHLEKSGYEITSLPVTKGGYVTAESVAQAIRPETACVSIMWANNETGIINPMAEISEVCQQANVPFHSDAVAAAGKLPFACHELGISAVSIAGHKIHSPKGIGALYLRRGTPFVAQTFGGGQEYGRRAGSSNVAGIIGLAKACELATQHMPREETDVARQRDRLESALLERFPKAQCNGDVSRRTCNTTNLGFPGVDGEWLILALCDAGLAASTGSACSAGSSAPSMILQAMHLPRDIMQGSLRLSLSRFTTDEEIERAIEIISKIVAQRLT